MQKSFGREVAGVLLRAVVVVLTIVVIFWSVSVIYDVESNISDGTCNIAVLPVEGVILPYYGLGEYEMIVTPDSIESFLDSAEADNSIKGVLMEVNSPGGTPVASARIAERFKNSSLPVVGLIGDMAASGGYMIASAADFLIASPMSDVGSIGVTMSYIEESKKNEEEGLTYVQLTTGEFKDAGSPNRAITDKERELFQENLEIIHNEFVDIVSNYRNMPIEEIQSVADGSSMPGTKAIDAGLIDALGSRSEARKFFAANLDVEESEVIFCEYKSGLLPF